MFFLTPKYANTSIPEVVWEIYLHDLVEIETKGFLDKELHVDYEHNEEILHRIFYGGNAQKAEQRLIALMQSQKYIQEHPRRVEARRVPCPRCKKMIDWRDHFCPVCGHRMRK
jgi:hypothetical protein